MEWIRIIINIISIVLVFIANANIGKQYHRKYIYRKNPERYFDDMIGIVMNNVFWLALFLFFALIIGIIGKVYYSDSVLYYSLYMLIGSTPLLRVLFKMYKSNIDIKNDLHKVKLVNKLKNSILFLLSFLFSNLLVDYFVFQNNRLILSIEHEFEFILITVIILMMSIYTVANLEQAKQRYMESIRVVVYMADGSKQICDSVFETKKTYILRLNWRMNCNKHANLIEISKDYVSCICSHIKYN